MLIEEVCVIPMMVCLILMVLPTTMLMTEVMQIVENSIAEIIVRMVRMIIAKEEDVTHRQEDMSAEITPMTNHTTEVIADIPQSKK